MPRPFANLNEARQIIEEWRIDYNTNRPHMSLNALTPNRVRNPPEPGTNQNKLSLQAREQVTANSIPTAQRG